MKRLATLVAVFLLAAFCSAQDSPSSADQEQSVAAAAKASRAQVKNAQSKEADIRHLLDLTHAGATATQAMNALEGNIRPLLTNSFPPGEYREKLIELFFQKFHSKLDQQTIVDLAVPVYEKYYSDEEIKQLIQLYDTPLGQKMLATMPKLMAELQAAGEKRGQELGRESMQEVLAEHPEMQQALQSAQKSAQAAR